MLGASDMENKEFQKAKAERNRRSRADRSDIDRRAKGTPTRKERSAWENQRRELIGQIALEAKKIALEAKKSHSTIYRWNSNGKFDDPLPDPWQNRVSHRRTIGHSEMTFPDNGNALAVGEGALNAPSPAPTPTTTTLAPEISAAIGWRFKVAVVSFQIAPEQLERILSFASASRKQNKHRRRA